MISTWAACDSFRWWTEYQPKLIYFASHYYIFSSFLRKNKIFLLFSSTKCFFSSFSPGFLLVESGSQSKEIHKVKSCSSRTTYISQSLELTLGGVGVDNSFDSQHSFLQCDTASLCFTFVQEVKIRELAVRTVTAFGVWKVFGTSEYLYCTIALVHCITSLLDVTRVFCNLLLQNPHVYSTATTINRRIIIYKYLIIHLSTFLDWGRGTKVTSTYMVPFNKTLQRLMLGPEWRAISTCEGTAMPRPRSICNPFHNDCETVSHRNTCGSRGTRLARVSNGIWALGSC